MSGFTPTEQALLDMLADGRSHSKRELSTCLRDDMAEPVTLRRHIFNLRKKLRGQGHLIICELVDSKVFYNLRRNTGAYDE